MHRLDLLVGSFSTTSRPVLRAAACGGRPRAGNDTTVIQRPASPNAAGWRSARGPRHFRQVSDGAVDSRSLGAGAGREALSHKLKLHRRIRGSSFGNGLEVGIFLPSYRASHRLTEPSRGRASQVIVNLSTPIETAGGPGGPPVVAACAYADGTQAMLYSSVAVVGSPSVRVLLSTRMIGVPKSVLSTTVKMSVPPVSVKVDCSKSMV
jgi:hypothetical protein